jgi:hypothetical protein
VDLLIKAIGSAVMVLIVGAGLVAAGIVVAYELGHLFTWLLS